MSELPDLALTHDVSEPLPTIDHDPAPPPAAVAHGAEAPPAVAVAASRPAATTEPDALLELIRRGLALDADPTTRAAARDICAAILQALGPPPPPAGAVAAVAPAAPVSPAIPPPMPGFVPVPVLPPPGPAMPTSPLAQVVGTLRNLPPEQLLELGIQRLRAALPSSAKVSEPKGIQFQLVPVMPPGGTR